VRAAAVIGTPSSTASTQSTVAIRIRPPSPLRGGSIVAVNPLAALVTLLGLHRQGGGRPGLETAQADRLAGLLAIAVGTVLDPAQGLVDLGDQLALAVAGPKLERPVRFR